jgi:hypothetical protein
VNSHLFLNLIKVHSPLVCIDDDNVALFCFYSFNGRYKKEHFGDSVSKLQAGTVTFKQVCMLFLNITQKLILQICLAFALTLASMWIAQRSDCCIEHGYSSGISECY